VLNRVLASDSINYVAPLLLRRTGDCGAESATSAMGV